MTTHPSPRGASAFLTTQWTRVLQARGNSEEAHAALGALCEAYYAPVYAFILRQARDEEKARDLTQEFFARVIGRRSLGHADPARGRFRSYLLGAVKHFLADARDHDAAAKRNPGQPIESLNRDTTDTSSAPDVADTRAPAPDVEFDRKWALTLLERTLAILAAEHDSDEKAKQFQALKPWLTGDIDGIRQSTVAAELAMNETTVKVAIHRLRRRFRDLLKQQIAATLPEPDPALVADEMSYLVSILR